MATTPSSGIPTPCTIPGAVFLIPGCQGQISQGVGASTTSQINNAAAGAASSVDQGLVNLLMADITGLIQAPFKALGIGGLKDAMWRLLLIGVGIMVLAFGLMIIAGSAVREEAGNPQVQQAASTAAMAA